MIPQCDAVAMTFVREPTNQVCPYWPTFEPDQKDRHVSLARLHSAPTDTLSPRPVSRPALASASSRKTRELKAGRHRLRCARSTERAGLIPIFDSRKNVRNSTTSGMFPRSASMRSIAAF
jgi:hypothetical protein